MNASNVLAVMETRGGLNPLNRLLVSQGRILAGSFGGELIALVYGTDLDGVIEELQKQCIDVLAVVRHPSLVYPEAGQMVKAIQKVHSDFPLRTVLLGHDHLGIETGCLLSALWSSSFTGNCLAAGISPEGDLFCIRPMFSGTVNAKLKIVGQRPYILTFQPTIEKSPPQDSRGCRLLAYDFDNSDLEGYPSANTVEILGAETDSSEISKARIVLAVGRGIGTAENLPSIFDIAESLGASVACSRPLVDLGWLPSKHLVGISGATISPKVYVALGISGAAQHLAGMMSSELVIAVNRDPQAPIFNYAHYGLVADVHEVLPVLRDEIENMIQTQ
ncbi:MAG: electron transfer flavoprotein subunit alpha/FixB family protein [Deltaproteobacteria bacterium]|nr:electron transfer flavoprotein subunit alpha/FixB family protein [Deltaproteobacteria bacterium]